MNPTLEQKWLDFKLKWDGARHKVMVWINALIVTAMSVDWVGVQAGLPGIQQFMPPGVYTHSLAIAAIANFVLHNLMKPKTEQPK